MKHFSQEKEEKQKTESHKSTVEREFCLHNLENRVEKENCPKNLTNRGEKENFVSKSHNSRSEREMKIQFSSSREKNMSHFFSRSRLLSIAVC